MTYAWFVPMVSVIQASTPMFLMGLAVGTSLLLIGLGLGLWMGRRMAPSPILEDSMQREQVLRFVRNFATWTSDFAGDFSKYQTQVRSLSQQVASHPEQFSATDLQRLLQSITEANQSLQARLDSAEDRLENQTKELASYLTEARTDGLTGLSNRRAFDQKLDERFARWTAHKRSFCLALIDIDFFKKINDSYGHPAGDAVLREVASQLRMFAGNGVEVARYGGEEFAILLDHGLEAAAKLIDQFRQQIQELTIEAEGKTIPVTISCGVSIVLPDERIGMVVRRADEGLYAAKAGGRNRLYYHDGKLCRPLGNPPPHKDPSLSASNVSNAAGSLAQGDVGTTRQQRLQDRLERLVREEGST